MVGYHGITGWSGGGRRPLTYSLMPGQMRNTRVNVFQSNYIMPMATCYYAEPQCECNHDSGMPSWLQWMMGIGMGTQLLGGIFSGIFGGGGSEGAGGASKKDVDAELDLRQLKTDYKNYTFSRYSDGTVRARDKSGKVVAQGDSPLELRDALDELNTNNTNTDTEAKLSANDAKRIIDSFVSTYKLSPTDITYNSNTGKFTYNGKVFTSDELETTLKSSSAQNNVAATPQNTSVVNGNSNTQLPRLFDESTMNSLSTKDAVINKFKAQNNGAVPLEISTISNGNIEIKVLHDAGKNDKKPKDQTGTITIFSEQLKSLTTTMGETSIGNFAGKDVRAQNLDGYLKIKVGEQTYIVGKLDNDTTYTGYQYDGGNIEGLGQENWTTKKKP